MQVPRFIYAVLQRLAPVAQGIEHPPPKRRVARSIRAKSAMETLTLQGVGVLHRRMFLLINRGFLLIIELTSKKLQRVEDVKIFILLIWTRTVFGAC